MKCIFVLFSLFFLSGISLAASLRTSCVEIQDPPEWMKERELEKVCDHVERFLEWPIKRVKLSTTRDAEAFQKLHGLGPQVRAFAIKSDQSIHLGPAVQAHSLHDVLAHELTHVILYQKYKDSIPKWLEEGLANHVAGRKNAVDYNWLSTQDHPKVETLGHAFKPGGNPRYHYMASSALIEMIAKKCNLQDLLQLSVGKKLETYIRQTCELGDLNASFKDWISKRSRN